MEKVTENQIEAVSVSQNAAYNFAVEAGDVCHEDFPRC